MCCKLNRSLDQHIDTCLPNGLLVRFRSPTSLLANRKCRCEPFDNSRLFRNTCTDPTWKDPACVQLCTTAFGKFLTTPSPHRSFWLTRSWKIPSICPTTQRKGFLSGNVRMVVSAAGPIGLFQRLVMEVRIAAKQKVECFSWTAKSCLQSLPRQHQQQQQQPLPNLALQIPQTQFLNQPQFLDPLPPALSSVV